MARGSEVTCIVFTRHLRDDQQLSIGLGADPGNQAGLTDFLVGPGIGKDQEVLTWLDLYHHPNDSSAHSPHRRTVISYTSSPCIGTSTLL
jgi:hypothetical protein